MSRSKGLYSLSDRGRSSPYVKPYDCEEGRLLDLVGDLLAQTVRDYLVVGKALKDLEAERKRGFYDREIAWERKSNASWERYEAQVKTFEVELVAYHDLCEKIKEEREMTEREMRERGFEDASIAKLLSKTLPFPKKPKRPKLEVIRKPSDLRTPYYFTKKSALETERDEMRGFFLGDTYKRFCSFPGHEVLNELDRQVEEYIPYLDRMEKKRK